MVPKSINSTKRDLNILIVDDDVIVLKTINRILESSNENYFISTAQSVRQAMDLLKKTYWDTILLDLSIPNDTGGVPDPKNGLHVIDILKKDLNLSTPVIAITGYNEEELSNLVLDKGAYYFLNKPLRPKYLSAIVNNSTKFQMSGYDGLTGLLNRVTFEERLNSEFMRTKRKNDEMDKISRGKEQTKLNLALIYIDVDNFKLINDTYSHLVGDHVLERIGSCFRDDSLFDFRVNFSYSKEYIIRPYDLAGRFGGDEFCVFLPETNLDNAITIAERIRDMFHRIDFKELREPDTGTADELMKLSFSFGIAVYPLPNSVPDYKELINLADAAMYASKQSRRGDIYGYTDDGVIRQFS